MNTMIIQIDNMNKHNDISLTSSLTKIESEYPSLF